MKDMNTKQQVIGTTEYLLIPEVSDQLIPTKVDTGADSSAIWASEIEEQDGELSFVLFGPQSAYYTGETIVTNDYSIVRVKNSFGEKEYRFRVKLSVRIGAKKYRVSFTLADRSRNRYPILLGKRFLKNRFLVDVAGQNLTGQAPDDDCDKVTVLTSRIDASIEEFFLKVQKEAGVSIELAKYRHLTYEIRPDQTTRILLPDGRDIATSSVVYFKAHALYPEHAGTIAQYLAYRHVDFVDQGVAHFMSRSKMSESFILALADIPVPPLKVLSNGLDECSYEDLREYFDESEFVVKDAFGDRGRANYIIRSEQDFTQAAVRMGKIRTIIAQQYVPNDGFVRILLMGGEVVQIVERKAVAHDDPLKSHLNKPRGSTNAVLHSAQDFDVEAINLARKAALALERNIAGVDLIQDKQTGQWYVLEVNYNPEMVGGFGQDAKITGLAQFLRKRN